MSALLENSLSLKIPINLYLGVKWHIFHILTYEDIDDVISLPPSFTVVIANNQFV